MKTFTTFLHEADEPFPYRVDYWKRGKYSTVKQRKFRTKEQAFAFVREKVDDDYETQTWGPEFPNGTTWDGSSRF